MKRRIGGRLPAMVIKRYNGRRLYNTATLGYLTLDDVRALAEDGVDIVVYDAGTGEDITQALLLPLQ